MPDMKATKFSVEYEYDSAKLSPEELGPMIKKKRSELNISQRQLAAELGVDYRKLSAWELGTIKSIPEGTKLKLFTILGIEYKKPIRIDMPLPSNSDVMEAQTAIQFLVYVMSKGISADSGITLTTGEKYNVCVKHNMRELLERFLLEMDQLNKE